MKKLNRKALLCGGVANYLLASHQSMRPQEYLTLENIEVMANAGFMACSGRYPKN